MTKKDKLEKSYTYESLLNSKKFKKDQWALSVALDPNKNYTLEEAEIHLNMLKSRKVV